MSGSLFRAQALDFAKNQSLGELVFHQPLGLRFAVIALSIVVVALLSFAALAPISETEIVRGHLHALQGSLRVYSTGAGTIDEVFVSNGDVVSAGEVLATVRRAAFDSLGNQALSSSIAKLRTQLQQEKSLRNALTLSARLNEKNLQQRQATLQQELARMDAQLRSLSLRRDLSLAQVQRQQTLVEKRQISVAQHENTLDVLYGFEQALQGLHAQKESRVGAMLALEQELLQLPFMLRQQLAASDSKIAQLHVQLKDLELTEHFGLTAPADGVVNNLLGVHGDAIDSRTPFATIIPEEAEFEALLYVPSRALAKIAEKQSVFLDYDSYPARSYGYFSAQVTEISQSILDPREHLLPIDMQEPFYLVRAAPQWHSSEFGERQQMRSGMQFTAHLRVGERTLLERLAAPLLTMRARV